MLHCIRTSFLDRSQSVRVNTRKSRVILEDAQLDTSVMNVPSVMATIMQNKSDSPEARNCFQNFTQIHCYDELILKLFVIIDIGEIIRDVRGSCTMC